MVKGQWRIKEQSQAANVWLEINDFFDGAEHPEQQAVIAEKMIPFDREVSLVGMRDIHGNTEVYPLVEKPSY